VETTASAPAPASDSPATAHLRATQVEALQVLDVLFPIEQHPSTYAVCGADTDLLLTTSVNRRLARIRYLCKYHAFADALQQLQTVDELTTRFRHNKEVHSKLCGIREALGDLYFCHQELQNINGLANFALTRR
jgi:hypothetical protein